MTHDIIIIDGYSFAYRAYYVLPNLTTNTGTPIGAVYGFTNMIIKMINNFKPKYVVVTFDSDKKNFRHDIYKEYKSNRSKPPDDLIIQFPLLRKVTNSLSLFSLEKPGYEADDIIATLTHSLSDKYQIIIVSPDKDILQLMNSNIKIFDPIKNSFIFEKDIYQKFGVPSNKIIEVMSLSGDKSDNIPGIPGVGYKTAAKIINEFGSIEQFIKVINTEQRYNKFKHFVNSIQLSFELISLNKNVPLPEFDMGQLEYNNPCINHINELISEFNFKSLKKKIESAFQIKLDNNINISTDNNSYKTLQVDDQVDFSFLTQKAITEGKLSLFFVDKTQKLILYTAKTIFVLDLKYFLEKSYLYWITPIVLMLQDKSIHKFSYNIKSLIRYLNKLTTLSSISSCEYIELTYYLISMGKSYSHNDIFCNIIEDFNEDLLDQVIHLIPCLEKIFIEHKTILLKENLFNLYENIDKIILNILIKIENTGIKINQIYLQKLSNEFSKNIQELEKDIFEITDIKFNINSPKQLGEILFNKMKLPIKKKSTKSNTYTTNVDSLEELDKQGFIIATKILRWRQFTKLKNTYTYGLYKHIDQNTNRIYTTFMQTSTSTGRLSSQNPNLQSIPIKSIEGNKIRKAFISEKQCILISADYSQIELRILSHIANVKHLQESFIQGEDIHVKTAAKIFKISVQNINSEHRRKAKAINFGIIYGISSFGLAKHLKISISDAQDYITAYFHEYPEILQYIEYTKQYAHKYGYVKNMFNRKCFIESINDKNKTKREFSERAAINAPIQSSSADIIKLAMIDLYKIIKYYKLKTRIILQIHDELLFEVPNSEISKMIPIIKNTMESVSPLKIPTIVDINIGKTWMNTKKY